MAGNEDDVEVEVDDGCIKQTDRSSYYIWQYFTVSNSSEAKKGGAKIAVCKFCDKTFSGCCTTRAAAHILGRPVLGQTKAGIQTCIAINKKDDDRRAILKNAQRALSEVMREKEGTAAGKKRKQAVMDEILTPCPVKSAESSMKDSQKSGPKELDAKIASYFYENGIAFNTAGSASFALMIEESMKFARQYPLQSYKVPNRHKFSGELLDKAYESTEKLVAPILAVGKKYGATIASDGWSDQHRRPILNWSAMLITGWYSSERNRVG
jgi:hypothetical protein